MKLRHDGVKEKDSFCAEGEGEKKWYNKLWDVTARMGKTLAKTLCVVSVPVLVASCSCGRMELEGDARTTPDVADVSHEDAPDVHDAVEEDVIGDVLPEDVVEEDVPEEELPPPCDYLYERSGINNLIGDYLNRRLNDRQDNEAGNTDTEYSLSGSDIPDTANPFSDGIGGSIGPSETFMYRVTGEVFYPLMDSTVYDDDAAITYTEKQSIWIRGSSYYSDVLDDVTGDVRFVAYTMKFGGESDDFGIRVCSTHPHEGDYTYCKSGAEDASYDLATELHKVRIEFLGEPWVITEMSPPVDELTNEMQVYAGGFVKIAQEAVSGIINQGESLPAGTLRFQLDDVEVHGELAYAIISVLNEAGDILTRDRIAPGQTKEFSIDGEVYLLHVYNLSPDYTWGPWADMAIFSREMKIEDGQHLDPDYDTYRDWQGVVGWKNKGASSTDTKPDHLRMVGIYADDIAAISSSGETTLLAGEGFGFPESEVALCYGGLDITDAERSPVGFTLERDTDLAIPRIYGPYDDETDRYVSCTIYAPYVKMAVGRSDDMVLFYDASEIPSIGKTAYIAASGAHCEGTIGYLESGSVFSEDEYSGMHHRVRSYSDMPAVLLTYKVDESVWELFGAIYALKWEDTAFSGRPVSFVPDFVFVLTENAGPAISDGTGNASMSFAFDGGSFNADMSYLDTGEILFRSGRVSYSYAGPVNPSGSLSTVGDGYITERGSIFASMDDAQVVYYVANRVAYSVYYIGLAEY